MLYKKSLLGCLLLATGPLLAQEETPPQTATAAPTSPWTYDEPTLVKDNPKPFGLKLEYGQNHAAGKASYLSRNGKFGAKFENGVDEVRLDGDSTYLKTSEEIVDDRRHVYFGYDRYIGYRLWLFVLHDWESNKPTGTNYTQLTGGGVKVDLMRNKEFILNIGAAYLKRARQTEFTDETTGITQKTTKDDGVISGRLKFGYETDLTRFSFVSFYQPVTRKNPDPVTGEKENDYSWSLETSLAYNVSKRVYLKYAYAYRFESIRTGPGAPREDEKTTLSVGYEL